MAATAFGIALIIITYPTYKIITRCKGPSKELIYRSNFHITICNTNLNFKQFTEIFENIFGKNTINKIQKERIYKGLSLKSKELDQYYSYNKKFYTNEQLFMYVSLNLKNLNKNGLSILNSLNTFDDNYMCYTYKGKEGLFRYNVSPNIHLQYSENVI